MTGTLALITGLASLRIQKDFEIDTERELHATGTRRVNLSLLGRLSFIHNESM